MAFDRESPEEQIALNMIQPIQRVAWDALEAGLDGPNVRRLAAEENLYGSFEGDVLLAKAMQEMQLVRLTKVEAAERRAKRRVREVLASNSDPFSCLSQLESLWRRVIGECSADMTTLGILDDEVSIARNQGQRDDEIREWLITTLKSIVCPVENLPAQTS
jgi:hypothetical protein